LTVRDLLGDKTASTSFDYPRDAIGPSGYVTAPPLFGNGIDTLIRTAGQVATKFVARLSTFLPCDPVAKGDEVCVAEFIRTFVRRAYRRPLETREADALMALYRELRKTVGLDFPQAIEHLVQAVLQSPQFLYLDDAGPGAEISGVTTRQGPYDVASHLSYFLWSSMPDAPLLAAADGNRLRSPAELRTEAKRMLADAKAGDAFSAFFFEWWRMDLLAVRDKNPKLFPDYDAVRSDMARETTALGRYVLLEGDSKLSTLLLAPMSFVNARLAKIYGLPDMMGTELRRVDLPATERAGLLTQPSLMAIGSDVALTSPVRRGVPIRERLLCDELAAPPGDVPPPPNDVKKSSREQFAVHTAAPACAACHKVMDPIGWAFEHYDAIGRYRTMDAGRPVDATGSLLSLKDGSEQRFDGAPALAAILARSAEVRDCVARQMFRFAHRREQAPSDAAALTDIKAAFAASGGDLRDLVLTIVAHRSFVEFTNDKEKP
jgi:hypothetical protein